MSLLLKNCLIFDPQSSFHNTSNDLLIEKGRIKSIGRSLKGKRSADLKCAWITPGLVDLNADFCDPGFEHKEDLKTGSEGAVSGGFTDVCVLPNTNPVVDAKGQVEYLLGSAKHGVDIHPIAAMSEDLKGENMTEILDLRSAGAVAFSDGHRPIVNSKLLLKTLQYIQQFDGLIISRCSNPDLSRNAQMHEGATSTSLGLNGEPSISEKMTISGQLEVLRYAGGRLHFSMVSTAEGLKLIKDAKKEGLRVTCDVSIHHLVFTDEDLTSFDSNFKVQPPFRSEKDRKALVKGVNDDFVDAIVSGHRPQDRESKLLEFDLAEPGNISLQTVFPALLSVPNLDIQKAILKLTSGPRTILGLEDVCIEEGAVAKLTFIAPEMKWTLNSSSNKSKSENSPYWNQELTGKCVGVVNGDFTKFDL